MKIGIGLLIIGIIGTCISIGGIIVCFFSKNVRIAKSEGKSKNRIKLNSKKSNKYETADLINKEETNLSEEYYNDGTELLNDSGETELLIESDETQLLG